MKADVCPMFFLGKTIFWFKNGSKIFKKISDKIFTEASASARLVLATAMNLKLKVKVLCK